MKLPGIAVAAVAITALVGGTAVAQVTMQPIPNPPAKAKAMGHHWRHHHGRHHHVRVHHHMHVHHHVMHHHHMAKKSAAPAESAAPAPAAPQ